ncbi:MAG: AbrB/MazE/SpoVT family DNA-binding domain-containing protein [Dehalococcoidia bacterium]|nr:MAG: AbrB/MazE/SpoVT family DNA-binding domain-containing protein [Dehalococcoidia bacterium]
MPVVKIRHKRQVTIPKEISSQLHLEVGDFVEATVENGRIVMIPKKLAVKAEIVPLTEGEQQVLLKAKRKIDRIREDILHSEGLSPEEIKIATKVGLIDPDQAWWWTEEWQEGEREAEKSELVGPFDSAEELIKSLRAK